MTIRVHRYQDVTQLSDAIASRMGRYIASAQARGLSVALCLSDSIVEVCKAFSTFASSVAIDPERIDLWWSDDRFVDVTDPTRVSTKTLAALGNSLRFAAGRVHPMPTSSGNPDFDAAALSYASELGGVSLDLVILAMGADGAVAGLEPGSSQFLSRTPHTVTAFQDDGGTRLSLTLKALNRSQVVWLIARGESSAASVASAVAGDAAIPAGVVRGRRETHLFVDEAAASQLPYYHCDI